jgi:hypothetical protein
MQHSHGKEYEKVLKTVSHPLKEGHHFDQQLGGVAGMFESIRSNTTASGTPKKLRFEDGLIDGRVSQIRTTKPQRSLRALSYPSSNACTPRLKARTRS